MRRVLLNRYQTIAVGRDDASQGLTFDSLPREVRAMIFDQALVGACPLRYDKHTGLWPKMAVDRHVIEDLNFLEYGIMPTFQLTHEARAVFWTFNRFQVDWQNLCTFALGFEEPLHNRALFLVPHDHIRRIRININTEGRCLKREDKYWKENLSRTLRRLIGFPVLQKVEIVIRMPVVSYNDKLIRHQVSQIQSVCRKLREKFGNGFTVLAERSAFESYEDEPYPWDASTVCRQDVEDGPEAPPVHSDDEDDDTDNADSDFDDGSDDTSIVFQRQNLSWIWMPPTEETLRNVAKDESMWMERTNVHLFERKPSHEQSGDPLYVSALEDTVFPWSR